MTAAKPPLPWISLAEYGAMFAGTYWQLITAQLAVEQLVKDGRRAAEYGDTFAADGFYVQAALLAERAHQWLPVYLQLFAPLAAL